MKSTPPASPPARTRGRPATQGTSLLNRDTIIACAFDMIKTVPLNELSIVKVAKKLGVTPALIHYYLDGREALTAGVVNAFFKEMLNNWPAPTDDWRRDVKNACLRIYELQVRYPGIVDYTMGYPRFHSSQHLSRGERDYGLRMADTFIGVIRAAGFDARQTAFFTHLIMEAVTSLSHTTVHNLWPGQNSEPLDELLGELDAKSYPNIRFVSEPYVSFDIAWAIDQAIDILTNSMAIARDRQADQSSAPVARTRTKPKQLV